MLDQFFASAHSAGMTLFGAWDLKNLLTGAQAYAKDAGGMFIVLLGIAMIIWGGFKLAKKLMANQQQGAQESWFTIILLIFVGGALMVGGFALLSDIAEGGKKTIEEIGQGFIMWPGLSF